MKKTTKTYNYKENEQLITKRKKIKVKTKNKSKAHTLITNNQKSKRNIKQGEETNTQ